MSRLTLPIVISLFSSLQIVAQEPNQLDEDGLKQGIWLTYYTNSNNIEWRYDYKNDKLDSIQQNFYKNG